ncbi:uncharacterized protein C17orf80 homolog isoform X2 [Candoia aspera]|uniref:uncharacterized protein C17orf80 homolog isoform X2 n=1 Tax=Candoia aspera TaxID=51853 RepID=UPI002FD7B1C4
MPCRLELYVCVRLQCGFLPGKSVSLAADLEESYSQQETQLLGRTMTGNSPQIEICPYCKKQFKRLKSHLPHCKMAGSEDSRAALPLLRKVCDSVTSELLNAEKKKWQLKSLETIPKEESKKSKTDLVRKKERRKNIGVAGTVVSISLPADKDIEKQIKSASEKSSQTSENKQRTSEELPALVDKKLFPKIKLPKKLSTVQKTRGASLAKEEIVSGLSLESLIRSGKATSESHQKPCAKQKQNIESPVEQNVSLSTDYIIESLQPIHQRLGDKIEQITTTHDHVRALENRCESSVHNSPLNEAILDNSETGQWPLKSLSGAEIALANRQQIVTDSVDKKSILELELTGNVGNGETGNNKTTIKACTSEDHVIDSCRRVSRGPVHLFKIPLAEKYLKDVKLWNMSTWLGLRDLSPQGMLGATFRAWNGYCNRNISVKKYGLPGISLLLLGWCTLSYAWSHDHIKFNRWRKYPDEDATV